jgi:hypothetical protein
MQHSKTTLVTQSHHQPGVFGSHDRLFDRQKGILKKKRLNKKTIEAAVELFSIILS